VPGSWFLEGAECLVPGAWKVLGASCLEGARSVVSRVGSASCLEGAWCQSRARGTKHRTKHQARSTVHLPGTRHQEPGTSGVI